MVSVTSSRHKLTARDDLAGPTGKCQDLDLDYDLVPRQEIDAPTEILQTFAMSSSFGRFVDKDGNPIGNFVSYVSDLSASAYTRPSTTSRLWLRSATRFCTRLKATRRSTVNWLLTPSLTTLGAVI